VISGDVANAAHVGGQVIYVIDVRGCFQAVLPAAQVEKGKFVGRAGLKFGGLEIDAPDPKTFIFQPPDEVVPNKATRAGYQDPGFSRHAELPFVRLKREGSILSDGEDEGQAK
jgi:hypothetical protein